jgi:transcriptional regulator with XRE-family HTH domain
VDWVRIGRAIRALRIHRRFRQVDLAAEVGCSRALIGRIEAGRGDRVTGRVMGRVAAALGARFVVRLDWNGEALDRLLDRDHAALVEVVTQSLQASGWLAAPETTFSVAGERGSIDVLAFHASAAALLVVEVKSIVPDVQATLASLDRKVRLASRIARDRGWSPSTVSVLLVVGDTRTSRRRVEQHVATFAVRFPDRIAAVRRFIASPHGRQLRGLWFLSTATHASVRHRVPRPRTRTRAGASLAKPSVSRQMTRLADTWQERADQRSPE